jgi:hypothetical protein
MLGLVQANFHRVTGRVDNFFTGPWVNDAPADKTAKVVAVLDSTRAGAHCLSSRDLDFPTAFRAPESAKRVG